MSKKFNPGNAKYKKTAFAAIALVASFAMFASSCADPSESGDDDKTDASTVVDEQVLKNGNFEFFEDGDGEYLYGTPDNWSESTGSGASSSDSASGILNTTAENWNKLTDRDLPQAMWDNDALDTDDDDYIDYNATPFDLPLRDPASAITENEDEDEDDPSDDYIFDEDAEYIANPYTHNYRWVTENGQDVLYDAAGNKVTYFEDEDGDYYTTENFEADSKIESNVLMIHNYVEDEQGTQTYYSSSTTLTLEANTAAKLSVWVKTSDLYYVNWKGERLASDDQHGAYIELAQSVGGTSLDVFRIENIDTEILNPYSEETGWANGNNGWVQYNIYVSACDYAETTITLTLGLGRASNYIVEGYAFFDDITYEKYLNTAEMVEAAGGEESFDGIVNDPDLTTTCNLLSTDEEKIFRVDKEKFNDGDTVVEHYSSKYNYYVDLAIASQLEEGQRSDVTLTSGNLSSGLTVDEDGFISSKNNGQASYIGLNEKTYGTTYIPSAVNINSDEDVIANLLVTPAEAWTSEIDGKYQSIIDEALKTAADLPGAEEGASTLLMLSARGAAYETVITDPSFVFEANEDRVEDFKIVSFWMKTSELDGKASVSVSARQTGKTSNSSSFEVDSTTVEEVTINDIENVYNGWVQCHALVSCSVEEETSFELVVNYGATTIKGTTRSDYRGGWAALTNVSVINVDEEQFGYADSETRAASLTISSATAEQAPFDEAFGNGNEIDTEIARPASYNGVNGGSASTGMGLDADYNDPYQATNTYEYAGLINKDNREAYAETYAELLATLDSSPLSALFGSDTTWNEVFGTATQPLLIANTVREFAETNQIYNYGYLGADTTLSADSYTAVSVRVKVSEGAIATVYLVDPSTKSTLSFDTPKYTFWYDEDGNVLKGEPDEDATRDEMRANIAYTLLKNGLYDDGNGNYFANLYNLGREYYEETASYYDENGKPVTFDELDSDAVYYSTADKTAYAPHYLVTSDGDRVYAYTGSGVGNAATYNYFVVNEDGDQVIDKSLTIKTFDTTVAVPRYTQPQTNTPYSFTIDAVANPELAGKWITVNFFIHNGSESKNYRLEMWSGTRDSRTTEGVEEGSYVLFDTSNVSIDQSTYDSLIAKYEDDIIAEYREQLMSKVEGIQFDSNDENIAYYEALAKEHDITVDLYDYSAQYYTYTLYDSATYIPFNAETAEEDQTGYDYSYSEYGEQLAVLRIDESTKSGTPMLNMFVDYSTTDKDITLASASDVTDDEDTDDTTTATDDTNVWLLASSIIMVAAILVAIAVLLLRDLRKKFKRRPQVSKNTFNYAKNKRYVRTYVKEHGETTAPTPQTDDEVKDESGSETVEETSEATESVQPEQTSDEEQSSVETESDEQTAQPEEQTPSEPADGEDDDKNN